MSRTYHHSRRWGKRHFYRLSTAIGPTPSWWVAEFMNRPKRRRDAALLVAVVAGKIDPDAAAYAVGGRRPHVYFW